MGLTLHASVDFVMIIIKGVYTNLPLHFEWKQEFL